jgi:hypothetical protein
VSDSFVLEPNAISLRKTSLHHHFGELPDEYDFDPLYASWITDGLKACLKISNAERTLLLEEEEDDECLDEDLEDELELAPIGPSGGSNAKTTSLKWPTNSGSLRKRSLHMTATSSGGLPNPGPRPKVPMQIFG